MTRIRLPLVAAAAALVLAGHAAPALAQDPQPAPAAAPAPAPAPPAVDSNLLWAGDWDFQAQKRDATISGAWRLTYANGQFTGVVALEGMPPSPVRGVTIRNHFRDFELRVDFNSETYVFTGHLDNSYTINGTLSTMGGGLGRMRASKRG
jgi:hypothetical protein